MYFKESTDASPVAVEKSNTFVIALATLITLVLGIVPGVIAEMFAF